jgi:hypothetical protein
VANGAHRRCCCWWCIWPACAGRSGQGEQGVNSVGCLLVWRLPYTLCVALVSCSSSCRVIRLCLCSSAATSSRVADCGVDLLLYTYSSAIQRTASWRRQSLER